jgi:hypothetical protein
MIVRILEVTALFVQAYVTRRPLREFIWTMSGPVSVVGIATAYGFGRSGDRIPVGVKFSAPVQTGPEAHPASCKTGTGSFPGVRCGRSVMLYLYSP